MSQESGNLSFASSKSSIGHPRLPAGLTMVMILLRNHSADCGAVQALVSLLAMVPGGFWCAVIVQTRRFGLARV